MHGQGCMCAVHRAHFVRRTFEDLQSSHAIRFLCRYAKPLAASNATCLPLCAHIS